VASGVLVVFAFALWYVIFVVPAGNFWLKITLASSLLAAGSVAAMGEGRAALFRLRLVDLAIGVGSALLLYGIFVLGKVLLTAILPRAGADIGSVYAPRGSLPLWLIGALLLLVTGPAEEIFWRGFLQHTLTARLGRAGGLVAATALYALVHLCTLNLPLILAAATAGLAWGVIFAWRGSAVAPIVSHALWGLLIFVLFPVA
jgi:hypothetical protein